MTQETKKRLPLPNKFTTFLRNVDAKGFDHSVCWNYLGQVKGMVMEMSGGLDEM